MRSQGERVWRRSFVRTRDSNGATPYFHAHAQRRRAAHHHRRDFQLRFQAVLPHVDGFRPKRSDQRILGGSVFQDGVNLSLGVTWSGKIAGRASSLNVTATYSTKEGADLSEVLLPANLKTGNKKGSYNVAFGFSHLLYELAEAGQRLRHVWQGGHRRWKSQPDPILVCRRFRGARRGSRTAG